MVYDYVDRIAPQSISENVFVLSKQLTDFNIFQQTNQLNIPNCQDENSEKGEKQETDFRLAGNLGSFQQ